MQHKQQLSRPFSAVSLLIALTAGVAAFLPFAVNTSAWSAVTLRVPGDQGNWWHFLAGAPFFIAFAIIWLSLRSLLALKTPIAWQRILLSLAATSICGTLLVEVPVIFRMGNLAQMGLRRQWMLLVPGFGLLALCSAIFVSRRKFLSSDSAVLIALFAAYLMNAVFCLGMYAPYAPQSGWYVTMALVWLISLEVIWIFFSSYGASVRAE